MVDELKKLRESVMYIIHIYMNVQSQIRFYIV